MPRLHDAPNKFETLRVQAEALIRHRPNDESRRPADMLELIDELKIHQAELEIQNEELKRAQEELSNLHQEFEALYEFAPCGYITLSAKRIITRANLTAVRLLGETKQHLFRSGFSRFIRTTDRRGFGNIGGFQGYGGRYQAALQKAAETGDKQSVDLPLKKEKGSAEWVRADIEADRNEAGEAIQWRIVLLDITQQRAADEARRESEEKFRSMMESMKDAVCIVSNDHRIEYMNPRMISRVGREAVGEICHGALYGRHGKCTWCAMDRVQEGEHVEYELERPEENRYYAVSNSPIYHADGTISKLTILRDVTGTKAMEAQLRQARKMESIGTLAGGIAHDFNNILYVILGNAELAMDVPPDGKPLRKCLEQIRDASLRGAATVKQLLNFSRMSEKTFDRIDAVAAVGESIRFLSYAIPATVAIRTDLPDTETVILADPTQIQQALMNLCINAAQEMEATGGTVDISVETVRLEASDIKGRPDLAPGGYAAITVRDTGPGIDPAIADRLFDPYFTTKEVGKGSGLGLSVVHGIAKNHRGAVSVASQPGKGAAFTLYLPLATGGKAPAVIDADPETPTGGESILFIDDEATIVNMGKQMLERLGYRVQTSRDPAKALALFHEDPDRFDLVITDMTMPGMTGVQLFRRLKAIRPDIPVLLCTGHSALVNEEEAGQLGIDGFIMKPMAKGEMARAIREALGMTDA